MEPKMTVWPVRGYCATGDAGKAMDEHLPSEIGRVSQIVVNGARE